MGKHEEWDDEDEYLEKIPARCVKVLKEPKERERDDGWD